MQRQWPFAWRKDLLPIRFAAAACLVLLLSACSTMSFEWKDLSQGPQLNFRVPPALTAQLENSEPCCRTLAELPYQSISRQGSLDVSIGKEAPTFAFATGKSRFAAFRLPDWPRPLMLRIDSFATAELGDLGSIISELRGLIFHPQVLLLDEQFRIVDSLADFRPGNECRLNRFFPALSGQFTIDSPPAEAAYLVIATTDALRNEQGASVCGGTIHGYSPIGKLELTIGSLGFGDGRIAHRGSYIWFKDAHGTDDVGFFSGMLASAGDLLLTGDGIHYVEWTRKGYVERFSVPYERIVSVKADSSVPGRGKRLLVLGVAGASADEIEYHSFQVVLDSSPGLAANLIHQRIATTRVVEKLGLSVATLPPAVKVIESMPLSAATKRVGESAKQGGILVALPCGICQTGLCSPEMLAPCAALFSVGALVGGVVGIGSELVRGTPPEQAVPRLTETASTLPTAHIAGMPLQQCLTQRLAGAATTGTQWTSQGRRAEVGEIAWEEADGNGASRYPGAKRNGYRFVAESRIEAVDLLAEGAPGQTVAEMSVRLKIVGKLSFHDLSRGLRRDLPLTWESDTHPWADWSTNGAGLLENTLARACAAIARQAVEQTEATWRDW